MFRMFSIPFIESNETDEMTHNATETKTTHSNEINKDLTHKLVTRLHEKLPTNRILENALLVNVFGWTFFFIQWNRYTCKMWSLIGALFNCPICQASETKRKRILRAGTQKKKIQNTTSIHWFVPRAQKLPNYTIFFFHFELYYGRTVLTWFALLRNNKLLNWDHWMQPQTYGIPNRCRAKLCLYLALKRPMINWLYIFVFLIENWLLFRFSSYFVFL